MREPSLIFCLVFFFNVFLCFVLCFGWEELSTKKAGHDCFNFLLLSRVDDLLG